MEDAALAGVAFTSCNLRGGSFTLTGEPLLRGSSAAIAATAATPPAAAGGPMKEPVPVIFTLLPQLAKVVGGDVMLLL